MRRLLSLFLFVVCVLGLSVGVLAIEIPQTYVKDGVTIAETFDTKSLDAVSRQLMLDWVKSDRNILIYTNAMEWLFVIVPESTTIWFVEGPNGSGVYSQMKNIGSAQYVKFQGLMDMEDGLFRLTSFGTLPTGTLSDCYCVVSGTYFDDTSYVFPDLNVDYLGDYEQMLLRDNSDVFAGGVEEDDGSGFWGKIWDWLTSFWETLKNLIISLFVPKEGYFDSWFETIRAAWEAKVGGLGSLLDSIKQNFGNLKGSSGGIFIALPSGTLYDSSPDMRVNLLDSLQPFFSLLRPILTALIAILTVVRCYHRLTELTKT